MFSLTESRQRRDPHVFVVGCPSSGTTLLQRLLNNHPDLAVANESQHLGIDDPAPHPTFSTPLAPEHLEALRARRAFQCLGLTEDDVRRAAEDDPTYRTFVRRIYAAFAQKQGKRNVGVQMAGLAGRVADVHALFPESRFVHILRDGRNVVISAFEWAKGHNGPGRLDLWRENPIGASALWWRAQVEQTRRAGRALACDRYFEVRYEHVTTETEMELRCISAFLHLRYSPEMARHPQNGPGNGMGRPAPMQPTAGLCDWRRQMRPDDVALFEALAGDQLEALGYPLSGVTVTPDVQRRADRCRAWWGQYEASLAHHESTPAHTHAA